MKRTQSRVWALFLLLAGTSVVVGDLFIQHGRPDWYEVGLGLLFLGLISVNHRLNQPTAPQAQYDMSVPSAQDQVSKTTGCERGPHATNRGAFPGSGLVAARRQVEHRNRV